MPRGRVAVRGGCSSARSVSGRLHARACGVRRPRCCSARVILGAFFFLSFSPSLTFDPYISFPRAVICTKVEGLKPNNYLPGGFGLDFGQNTKPQLFDGNITPFSLLLTRVRREVERIG